MDPRSVNLYHFLPRDQSPRVVREELTSLHRVGRKIASGAGGEKLQDSVRKHCASFGISNKIKRGVVTIGTHHGGDGIGQHVGDERNQQQPQFVGPAEPAHQVWSPRDFFCSVDVFSQSTAQPLKKVLK